MFPRNYWSSSFSRCRTRGGLSNSAAYCFSISFYTIVVVITVVVASRHRRLFLLVFCIIPIFFSCDNRTAGSGRPTSQALPNSIISSKAASHLSHSLGPTAVWLVLFSSSAIWSPHIWKLNHLTPQLETIDGGGAAILSSQMKTSLPAFESKKNVVKKRKEKEGRRRLLQERKKEREDLKWSR